KLFKLCYGYELHKLNKTRALLGNCRVRIRTAVRQLSTLKPDIWPNIANWRIVTSELAICRDVRNKPFMQEAGKNARSMRTRKGMHLCLHPANNTVYKHLNSLQQTTSAEIRSQFFYFKCNKKYKDFQVGYKNLHPKVHKHIRQEYLGVLGVLRRSGLNLSQQVHSRHISTSSNNFQQQTPPPNPNGKKPNNKDDEDDNKISSLLAKAFLWMLTAYMLIAIVSLLFPSSNQPEVIRYVSWNEFVHHMLAKGEVEEVIVRPDVDIVTIILHDGAIIKGKRIDHKTFHMNIVDMKRFEEKLREAERNLGIKVDGGVPVMYERSSDTAGKLLASLIVVGLLLSLLSRSKGIRPPISMDSITQLGRAKFTLVDPLTGPGKGVHFADVAGLKEAKQEVMEFVDYLKRPEHYKSLGAKVPKGALLLGPPGCGKHYSLKP
ncbi:hypothetical protein L9F63_007561, partial [Diploptera punctata]